MNKLQIFVYNKRNNIISFFVIYNRYICMILIYYVWRARVQRPLTDDFFYSCENVNRFYGGRIDNIVLGTLLWRSSLAVGLFIELYI